MSETAVVNIAKRANDVNISPQFDGYSAVRIYVGTDEEGNEIVYEAGNVNGRVLDIQNPFGSQAMANNILSEIKGYQYQPLSANSAILDPSAEMGDGVAVNGVYTGIFVRSTQFGRLMASDISAPTDEEIAHEYSVESASSDKEFTRFVRETKASIALTSQQISAEVSRATAAEGTLRASIIVNANSISSEVSRATAAEGTLSTRITQTANSISSEVTRAQNAESSLSSRITQTASSIDARVTAVDNSKLSSTRTNSSFGWSLTASGFYLNSNGNTRIFEANSNGIKISGNADITGRIAATSGYIGNGTQGFQIRASAITNGKSSLYDNYDGVYIGTNGIALGSKFKVDSSGNVTASNMKATNMELDGLLTIGGEVISADTLRQGAEIAWQGHNDWDWSTGEVSAGSGDWNWSSTEVNNNGSYWSEGAAAGNEAKEEWNNAHNPYTGVGDIYASAIIADAFTCHGRTSLSDMYYDGYPVEWVGFTDRDGNSHFVMGYY